MRYTEFFSRFGNTEIWETGKIGKKGFTVEELYEAFINRWSEEMKTAWTPPKEISCSDVGHIYPTYNDNLGSCARCGQQPNR